MQVSPQRKQPAPRAWWLIPALSTVVLFVGGVIGNLVASDLQVSIGRYRRWVWIAFVIALIVTISMAIVQARKGSESVASVGHPDFEPSRPQIIQIHSPLNPVPTALHQLREPVRDFVGREEEIDSLVKALSSGVGASISGLSGMGGIGKTELALLAAQRVLTQYPDAQLFINLQGAEPQPRRPEEVLKIFIRAFRGHEVQLPDDREQLKQIYLSELHNKRALIVLDNAADSAQVMPLLPPRGCGVLVTSRESLTLPGMTRLAINPLPPAKARELLLEIAAQAKVVADQVCQLCGYLPLAIRAAGSLLATTDDLDPAEYAVQLKDERTRLERIGVAGVEIGFEASFNLSYARLDAEAARVFRQLSVFPGTFDAAAEVEVCADVGHRLLSDLVRRSLVLYDVGTKLYRLHDLR